MATARMTLDDPSKSTTRLPRVAFVNDELHSPSEALQAHTHFSSRTGTPSAKVPPQVDTGDPECGEPHLDFIANRLDYIVGCQDESRQEFFKLTTSQNLGRKSLDELSRHVQNLTDVVARMGVPPYVSREASSSSGAKESLAVPTSPVSAPEDRPARLLHSSTSLGLNGRGSTGNAIPANSNSSRGLRESLMQHGSSTSDLPIVNNSQLQPRDFLVEEQEPLSNFATEERIFDTILEERHMRGGNLANLDSEIGNPIRRSPGMLHPQGNFRMAHDVLSVVVLIFDVMCIPVFLAWEVEIQGALRVLAYFSWLFWFVDFVLSFSTGVYIKGDLEMSRGVVAKRYICSWFILDMLVLTSDLFSMATAASSDSEEFSSGKSGTGLLRLAKAGRFLRLARLMRMARVSEIFARVADILAARSMDVVVDTSVPLIIIVVFNHLLACLWYGVGVQGASDTGMRWVDEPVGVDETYRTSPPMYQYTTAVHWAMTQMTPGSMQVFPKNSVERGVNLLCLLLGMLVFSSVISLLSAKLMQRQVAQKDRSQKLSALRRFLRKKGLAPRHSVLIEKAAVEALSMVNKKPVIMQDIQAIQVLPSSLRHWLKAELCRRHLVHPLFRLWAIIDSPGIAQVCQEVVKSKALANGDVLFLVGGEANHAYHFIDGSMLYSGDGMPEIVKVGTFISEATLWTKWTHPGQAIAQSGCEFLEIDAAAFGKLVMRQRFFKYFAVEYGLAFLDRVAGVEQKNIAKPSDLQLEFTSLAAILPTMSSESRLLAAAAATKFARGHLGRRRLGDDAFGIGQEFEKEAREGKCTLMLNEKGDIERIVAIQVIAIQNDEGKVLTEIGKVTADQTIAVDVKLPGKKQIGGEASQSTIQRVLQDILAPYASSVKTTHVELEESSQISKRAGLVTKYMRFVNYAICQTSLDHLMIDFEAKPFGEVKQQLSLRQAALQETRRTLHTRDTLHSRASTGTNASVVDEAMTSDFFALCDPKGHMFLYTWLDSESREYFRTSAGEEILQRFFEDKKVPESLERLAHERHKIASEVAKDRWEVV
mmetsp:Transcript_47509/g.152599  ORF Transcript_47509/g.152599 Transcript_47509/m.152599 type:complete len:1047 (+) Transcript_47509:68-3208(+)